MNIKEEVTSYSSENILDKNALIPLQRNLDRNKAILRIETILKRFIDIIGSIVGIVCLIPLTIIIWIANLIMKDNGPIFYTQERIGKTEKYLKCINTALWL